MTHTPFFFKRPFKPWQGNTVTKLSISALLLFNTLLWSLPVNSVRCPCNGNETVFGVLETAKLINIDKLPVDALIDTGATTTAMDARNIHMHINRQGKRWVYYDFVHKPTGKRVEKLQPVARVARIVTHKGPPAERPVVMNTIAIGQQLKHVEVSLINRSRFPQQLLIGRNFLSGTALVNSGKKYRTYALTAPIKDGFSHSFPTEKLFMNSQVASLRAPFLTL